MSILSIILILLVCAVVVVLIASAECGRRRIPQVDVVDGFIYLAGSLYVRLTHRLKVEIQEDALEDLDGPIIVVCNHTAGVDPILVSSVIPRQVRWLMAEDMRIPWLSWFWKRGGIIFVARNRSGRSGMRIARTHLQEEGMIGIFPEGKIGRPHGNLLPFAPGVGVLVKRTGARVLPVIIDGTPDASTAWESLWTPSHSRVRVMKPIDYTALDLGNAEIAKDLEDRFIQWTGWERGQRESRDETSEKDSKNPSPNNSTNKNSANNIPASNNSANNLANEIADHFGNGSSECSRQIA
ncbi:MAG: lysophospholipid acyltransferase family protein [Phycisphaerales bacterium]